MAGPENAPHRCAWCDLRLHDRRRCEESHRRLNKEVTRARAT